MLAAQMQLLRYTSLPGLCIVCYLLIFKDQTIPKCCQLKMQTYLLLVSERGHFKTAIFDDTVISVFTAMFGKMEREVEEKWKGRGGRESKVIFSLGVWLFTGN